MVLQAYVDDSGSEPQEPVFVLAGFVASANGWAEFSNDWHAALNISPRLDYFKMSEAGRLQGQFSRKLGWTEKLRDARLSQLVEIIKKHVLFRLSASMRNDEFERFIRSVPAKRRTLATDGPYVMLFTRIITLMAFSSVRQGIEEQTDFIFDTQLGFSDEALRQWPAFLNHLAQSKLPQMRGLVGRTPTFQSDTDFLPLQAADLYAWQRRRQLKDSRYLWVPEREVLAQLSAIPEISWDASTDELLRLRSHLEGVGRRLLEESPGERLQPFGGKRGRRQ